MLEQIYVSETNIYTNSIGYNESYLIAHPTLAEAVSRTNVEVEVGIYQLIRVVKFKKTVEIKTILMEIERSPSA